MDLVTIAKGTDYGDSVYYLFKADPVEDVPKPKVKKKTTQKPTMSPPADKPFNVNDYIRDTTPNKANLPTTQSPEAAQQAKQAAKKVLRKKTAKTAAKVIGGAALTAAAWKAGKHVPGARKGLVAGGAAAAGIPAAKWGMKQLKAKFTQLPKSAKIAIGVGGATAAAATAAKVIHSIKEAGRARTGAGAGAGVGGGGRGGRWGGRGRGGGGGGGTGADAAASAASAGSKGRLGVSPGGWGRNYRAMSPVEQAAVRRKAAIGGAAAGGAFVGADLQHRRDH